eukprot:365508-Chlamydomonas_euryale.AAC.11
MFLYGCKNVEKDRGSGGQTRGHSFSLRRIVGVKLTDRRRLEPTREQCATSSLELMDRRRTLKWMGHVLRTDEGCLLRQVFDCSLAMSFAEDGRMEQLNSAMRGCHEEGPSDGTTFRDFLKFPSHTKLILWPEIRAAAAERALDRQGWRNAIKTLAPGMSEAQTGWTYDTVLCSPWQEWPTSCNRSGVRPVSRGVLRRPGSYCARQRFKSKECVRCAVTPSSAIHRQ